MNTCIEIKREECEGWSIDTDGNLAHSSGRYFKGSGIEGKDGSHKAVILQPEIGMLGWLRTEHQFLVYHKYEPGNVGEIQLAPTLQATRSNLDRVHSGSLPRFAELFSDPNIGTLQSENQDVFHRKTNRNATVMADSVFEEQDIWYEWMDNRELVLNLGRDFTVNSDARSSLVCSTWNFLPEGDTPFHRSLKAEPLSVMDHTIDLLDKIKTDPFRLIPFVYLPKQEQERFRYFRVHSDDREVADWCQPLYHWDDYRDVRLAYFVDKAGVARFLIGLSNSFNLPCRAELTCSKPMRGIQRATFIHSEEGGRFYQCRTQYRLIEVPLRNESAFSLADLQMLALQNHRLDNDLRCALTLVFHYMTKLCSS